MPDWSYQPILKPVLRSFPSKAARRIALGGMRLVNSLPLGPALIQLLGHMTPDQRARWSFHDVDFPSRVGIAAGIDPDGVASGALSRFGVGLIVVGPIATRSDAELIARHFCGRNTPQVPVAALMAMSLRRQDDDAASHVRKLLEPLADQLTFVIAQWSDDDDTAPNLTELGLVRTATADWRTPPSVLARVHKDGMAPHAASEVAATLATHADGMMIVAGADAPEVIRGARSMLSDGSILLAETSCENPREALQAIDAGADLLVLNQGMVAAGPGLPKRINEALDARVVEDLSHPEPVVWTKPWLWPGWIWAAALGIGMIVGGLITFAIGITSVLLPYDQSFVGLDRGGIDIVNSRLIPFMRHDRITLAGTLMAIGVIYTLLAIKGMRERWRWSRQALLCSGVVGFASLFLFLGFHYVDPAHVILSGTLFPLFVIGMSRSLGTRPHPCIDQINDRVWRRGLWGQLLFIGLGAGLIGAGLIISFVGITTVFVESDLSFLRTTADHLVAANARILPLIAHDRAGFGGALVSDGIAVALVSLWGYRRGARWIWWTFLVSGGVGLSCGIFAHISVGYLELGHLLPLFVSGVVFIVALWLSYPYLCDRSSAHTSQPGRRERSQTR